MAAIETNYTNHDEITIEQINEPPVSIGYSHTFGSVFGAINKIIKAIINKFKNIDDTFNNVNDEVSVLHKGKTDSISWDILVTPGSSITKTINVDGARHFTHGYVTTNGKSLYTLTQVISSTSLGTSFYGSGIVDGYKKTGTADISCQLTHDNGGTQLKITFTSSNIYAFKYDNFTINYEIY